MTKQLSLFEDQPPAEGPVHATKHPDFTVYSQQEPDRISGHVAHREGHTMSFELWRNAKNPNMWHPETIGRSKFPAGTTPIKAVVDHLREYHPDIRSIQRRDVARGHPKGEVKDFPRDP